MGVAREGLRAPHSLPSNPLPPSPLLPPLPSPGALCRKRARTANCLSFCSGLGAHVAGSPTPFGCSMLPQLSPAIDNFKSMGIGLLGHPRTTAAHWPQLVSLVAPTRRGAEWRARYCRWLSKAQQRQLVLISASISY